MIGVANLEQLKARCCIKKDVFIRKYHKKISSREKNDLSLSYVYMECKFHIYGCYMSGDA